VGTGQGYTLVVPAKDPHVVLGVEVGAGPDEVKVAWRRLARQHHPDLTGDDPEASQRATRRMAEINAAYAALTRPDGANRRGRAGGASANGTAGARDGAGTAGHTAAGRTGGRPPAPKPTRPVTGRLDTTETFRPRNQTTTPDGATGRLMAASPAMAPLGLDYTPPEIEALRRSGHPEDVSTAYGRLRFVTHGLTLENRPLILVVGVPLAQMDAALGRYRTLLLLIVPTALLITAVAVWWLSGWYWRQPCQPGRRVHSCSSRGRRRRAPRRVLGPSMSRR